MTSVGLVDSSSGFPETSTSGATDRLTDDISEMSIRDKVILFWKSITILLNSYDDTILFDSYWHMYQEVEAVVVSGNSMDIGHTIVTTVGGRNGQPKQVLT